MRMLLLIGLGAMAAWAVHATDTSTVQPASSQSAAVTTTQPANADEKKESVFKPPPGYKTKTAGATKLYCKKTTVIGTRFPKEVCMTEAQLKDHLATNDSVRREKDQSSRICNTAAACGGT